MASIKGFVTNQTWKQYMACDVKKKYLIDKLIR